MPPRAFFDQQEFFEDSEPCGSMDYELERAAKSLLEEQQEQPQTPPTTSKKSLSVRFNAMTMVSCQTTLHLNDYTEEERAACWYNGQDMRRFKADASHTAQLLETHQLVDDTDDFCLRGAQERTRTISQQRQRLRTSARESVLGEQWFQQQDGMKDEDYLAHLYQQFSIPSQEAAQMTAMCDALQAAH